MLTKHREHFTDLDSLIPFFLFSCDHTRRVKEIETETKFIRNQMIGKIKARGQIASDKNKRVNAFYLF